MGILDDRDASVTYTGNWGRAGEPYEYMSTTTFSDRIATASVVFTGTGIGVYGTIAMASRGSAPISSYTIDDDTSGTRRFTGVQTNQTQASIAFFETENLSQGQHTLIISNESVGGTLFLDYFIVENLNSGGTVPTLPSSVTSARVASASAASPSVLVGATSPSMSAGALPPSVSAGATSPSVSAGAPPPSMSAGAALSSVSAGATPLSADNTSVSANTTQQKSETPLAAILGGTLGGLAAICLLILAFFVWKWKRKATVTKATYDASPPQMTPQMTPFILSNPSPAPSVLQYTYLNSAADSQPTITSISKPLSSDNHFTSLTPYGSMSNVVRPVPLHSPPQNTRSDVEAGYGVDPPPQYH